MSKSEGLILAVTLGLFLLFAACATKKLESRLDPLSDEFFDKVRYIITRAETKIFFELPPSARAGFRIEAEFIFSLALPMNVR